MCVNEAGGYFCETHAVSDALLGGDGPPPNDAAGDAARDAPHDSGSTTDAQTMFSYAAVVAECTDPRQPDTALCRSLNGNTQLVADGKDSNTGDPWNAYVRFNVDGAIAGKTVLAATLVLTSTDATLAPSSSSGAVWQVTRRKRTSSRTRRCRSRSRRRW